MIQRLIALSVLLLAAPAGAAEWTQISGNNSGITEKFAVVISGPEEWARLWSAHTAHLSSPPPLPEAEFSKEVVVAVFLGTRPNAGWKVAFETQADKSAPAGRVVSYRELKSGGESFLAAVMTQPFSILKLAKTPGTVKVLSARDAETHASKQQTHRKLTALRETADRGRLAFD